MHKFRHKLKFLRLNREMMRMFSTTIDPVEMAFDVRRPANNVDESKAVLVLHGLLGSKRNWNSISRNLAQKLGLQVYSLDARNHGESPHVDEHSEMHVAADLAYFINQQNLQSVYTIGHSMGGRAMMYFALSYPDICERLVVVDISPVSPPINMNYMTDVLNGMKEIEEVPAELSLSEGRKIMRRKLMKALDASADSNLDFILMNFRKNYDSGEFYWTVNIDALLRSLADRNSYWDRIRDLPPFPGPVLFICGSDSPFFNEDDWPDIQGVFPNSKLEWLPTGHLVHIERPRDFLQLTSKFLT